MKAAQVNIFLGSCGSFISIKYGGAGGNGSFGTSHALLLGEERGLLWRIMLRGDFFYMCEIMALFAWLISHQPTVIFSQNKPATGNQAAILFSQNKSALAISHQPNEQSI
jgi:hypothetical protein